MGCQAIFIDYHSVLNGSHSVLWLDRKSWKIEREYNRDFFTEIFSVRDIGFLLHKKPVLPESDIILFHAKPA